MIMIHVINMYCCNNIPYFYIIIFIWSHTSSVLHLPVLVYIAPQN